MRLLITFLILVCSTISYSQQSYNLESRFRYNYSDSSDVSFLNKTESLLYENIEKLRIFQRGSFGFEFTTSEIKHALMPNNLKPTNTYELNIVWNTALDTGIVLAFARGYKKHPYRLNLIKSYRDTATVRKEHEEHMKKVGKQDPNQRSSYISMVPFVNIYDTIQLGTDTSAHLSVPYSQYLTILNNDDSKKLNRIITKSVLSHFNIEKQNDYYISETYLSILRDHKNYLSHADLNYFAEFVTNSNIRSVYNNPELTDTIPYSEFESRCKYHWDSTAVAEDPENPGTMICAPVKRVMSPIAIVIVETWKTIDVMKEYSGKYKPLFPPYTAFTKKITAIGITYSGKSTVYFDYEEIQHLCMKSKIGFEPYKQIFIGASSKKLKLEKSYDARLLVPRR